MDSLYETTLSIYFLNSHSHSIVYWSQNSLETTLRYCACEVVEFHIFKIMRTQASFVLWLLWRSELRWRCIDELPINGLWEKVAVRINLDELILATVWTLIDLFYLQFFWLALFELLADRLWIFCWHEKLLQLFETYLEFWRRPVWKFISFVQTLRRL